MTGTALFIQLNPNDDVAIACCDLPPGTPLQGDMVCRALIPAGHKVAVGTIVVGAPVRRYGQIIGFASQLIQPGDYVHVHNVSLGDFTRDYAYCADAKPTRQANDPATFQGIVRSDGRVGTRNFLGVISTVNCSATVVRAIADAFDRDVSWRDAFPNVDGVVALTHNTGCGMGDQGEDIDIVRRTLAGYVRHPNFAGILLIGLGCEANQMPVLLASQGLEESGLLRTMTLQAMGGTSKTIAHGIQLIHEMLPSANQVRRETVEASHLITGLQCGGSDGYSGMTANPALGVAADLLVESGGTVILSETPEIYGAEHLLTRRAISEEVGEKLVARIKWWEDYMARHLGQLNNNRSPGNKDGGLTTILEKSLGGVAKGGSTNLVDVVEYACPVLAKGLVFMDTPGYDPVSATGQVAGGANLICFTTGRGSAYGCKPVPSLKLATNSKLYEHQFDDMDINCGGIALGEETVQEAGHRIFRAMLDTASGKQTKSEQHGYGQNEFVPWVLGATV
ncbi:UxaA family hydrolase [Advenella sp. FME57]|uniref:UxaA family hydrolase n=1 Tax=Advenella sp. FME57 TaxID=2742604 RepID=UPI0018681F52|nr:altronate dehydratase family protein [Advenella sp. FME57]